MAAAVQSIRSNSQPVGGTAAQQPVPATGIPGDVAALVDDIPQSTIAAFRAQSSPLTVQLNPMALALGDQKELQIANVGLGYRILAKHSAVITIANASGSTQTIGVGPSFPYNMISNTSVKINGGAQVFSADGYASLLVAARTRWGGLNGVYNGSGAGLSNALVNMTATGSGVTTTASNGNLSGFSTIVITTGNTATVAVTWVEFIKLAFSRDSLLGALPLQNNSTYAVLQRNCINKLWNATNDRRYPFYLTGGSSVTFALVSYSVKSEYDFWSIPSDPGLYQDMVSNSYQVLTATGLTASATGSAAITYNIPQNNYLTSLHMVCWDANGTFLTPFIDLNGRVQINYNAQSVIPINYDIVTLIAREFFDGGNNLTDQNVGGSATAGYVLWDGNATADNLNASDQAGWVDAYATASPQFQVDILGTPTLPVGYQITRESIVAGAVSVIGG